MERICLSFQELYLVQMKTHSCAHDRKFQLPKTGWRIIQTGPAAGFLGLDPGSASTRAGHPDPLTFLQISYENDTGLNFMGRLGAGSEVLGQSSINLTWKREAGSSLLVLVSSLGSPAFIVLITGTWRELWLWGRAAVLPRVTTRGSSWTGTGLVVPW